MLSSDIKGYSASYVVIAAIYYFACTPLIKLKSNTMGRAHFSVKIKHSSPLQLQLSQKQKQDDVGVAIPNYKIYSSLQHNVQAKEQIVVENSLSHKQDNEIILFRSDGLKLYRYSYIDGNLTDVTEINQSAE